MYINEKTFNVHPEETKTEKEMQSYLFLEENGVAYIRAEHDEAATIELCEGVEKIINTKINEINQKLPTFKRIATVKFTDEALMTILNVPRVFLPLVLKGCVDWAKENNCELITAAEMKIINDKRAKEKNKK